MESTLMSCEKISIKVVEKLIIQNISLAVNKNQIVGLLGPNGAGKTSTFYAIAGIVKINSGKILFQENEIHNLPIHCLLYTSPSPRDATLSRMPSSA